MSTLLGQLDPSLFPLGGGTGEGSRLVVDLAILPWVQVVLCIMLGTVWYLYLRSVNNR